MNESIIKKDIIYKSTNVIQVKARAIYIMDVIILWNCSMFKQTVALLVTK